VVLGWGCSVGLSSVLCALVAASFCGPVLFPVRSGWTLFGSFIRSGLFGVVACSSVWCLCDVVVFIRACQYIGPGGFRARFHRVVWLVYVIPGVLGDGNGFITSITYFRNGLAVTCFFSGHSLLFVLSGSGCFRV